MHITYSSEEIKEILKKGEIEISGRFTWGSNFTFLVSVAKEGRTFPAVYKPSRGERPLWDFPQGSLAAREVAAYITSESLGWELVPPTVLRREGPAGGGSLQLYVDADPEHHYFTFNEEEKQELRPVAVFDLLINNADRKGGHILKSPDGHIWSIDHGVCFHRQDKLRTVIWDFSGEKIPDPLLADIGRFHTRLEGDPHLCQEYEELISAGEFAAMKRRGKRLLEDPFFPQPRSSRPYPWPLV
jgi:uncharacterized repeat protein (TIGR03843 family)